MDIISTPAFQGHVEALIKEWHVPGLSVAVFNSTSIEAKGFGKSSINSNDTATKDTLYDWASCSKSITAAAVGKLVDSGKCEWSSRISDFLPDDFVLPDDDKTSNVTIEDALSHRTGMAGHDFSFFGENSKHADDPESITRKFRDLASLAPLRTKYCYCNMMFVVCSYLVEKISGQSFASFLKENIFGKIDMDSAYLQPSAALKGRHATELSAGHAWNHKEQMYNIIPKRDQYEGQGAGLIQASVLDFAKWCQAVLSKNTALFSEDIYLSLLKPRTILNPDDVEKDFLPFENYGLYALGWIVSSYREKRLVCHGGSESGFRSGIYILPGKDFGCVIAGNSSGAEQLHGLIANELMDRVLGCEDKFDWVQFKRDDDTKNEKRKKENIAKLRAKLSGRGEQTERASPASIPVSSYTGDYHNKGYGKVTVTQKDNTLYIDATDRGIPITITFEHVYDDRAFITYILSEDEGEPWPGEAQFKLDNSGQATNLGLTLDDDLDELIWFEKQ